MGAPVLPSLKQNVIRVIVFLLEHDISGPFTVWVLNWQKQLINNVLYLMILSYHNEKETFDLNIFWFPRVPSV